MSRTASSRGRLLVASCFLWFCIAGQSSIAIAASPQDTGSGENLVRNQGGKLWGARRLQDGTTTPSTMSTLPSREPSVDVSATPSQSSAPSAISAASVSQTPSLSQIASVLPSNLPSSQPSKNPTDKPSEHPSDVPSFRPSGGPSSFPSDLPSLLPSLHPSSNPTEQPNCTSTTNGPLAFERYIAVRVGHNTTIRENDHDLDQLLLMLDLEAAIMMSYHRVAGCPQKGSFRIVDEVFLVRENLAAATTTSREFVFGLSGTCEGCLPDSLWLFRETEDYYSDGGDFAARLLAPHPRSLMLEAESCSCPIPSKRSFDEALSTRVGGYHGYTTPVPLSIEIVELSDSKRCEAPEIGVSTVNNTSNNTNEMTAVNIDSAETQNFTTTIVVRFLGDLSDLDTTQSNQLAQGFLDTYHAAAALTVGNCDLYNRIVTSVQVELERGIGRRQLGEKGRGNNRLRSGPFSSTQVNRRLDLADRAKEQETTEVLFTIEGSCRACGGLLFEHFTVEDPVVFEQANNDTNSSACLCPVQTTMYGLDTEFFRAPLQACLATTFLPSSIEIQIDEVVEVDPVSCPVEAGTFQATVVVEVNVDVNSTRGPMDEEFDEIADAYVTSYNRAARDFCDPYRRRLTGAIVARRSEEGLFGEEPLALELNVSGTCLGCDESITLYDSVSILTSILSGGPSTGQRYRQLGAGKTSEPISVMAVPQYGAGKTSNDRELQAATCYCDVNSIPDQGASEPKVIEEFAEQVSDLSLPNIESVEDCQFLTFFTSSVILSFAGSPENATEEELNALGQGFVDTYNRINSGGAVCDRQFRQLVDFRVETNITINEEFLETSDFGAAAANEEQEVVIDEGDRRTLTWQKIERRRHLEDLNTLAGNGTVNDTDFTTIDPILVSPTPSPTIFRSDSALVLLVVSGTCRGCASNFGLFDQVSPGRRQLQGAEAASTAEGDTGEIELDFLTATGSCFCPPEAVQAEPSTVIVEAFEETVEELRNEGRVSFVEELEELEEVAVVQCVLETNQYETILIIDFDAYFDEIGSADLETIRDSFNTTYNRLSENFCDALFRRSEAVGDISYEQISPSDGDGMSRVRFYLTIEGRCHGCADGEPPLLPRYAPSRLLKEEDGDLCFCGSNTIANRAPTEDEFEVDYIASWRGFQRSRDRKLNGDALVEVVRVGLDPPTAAPSSIPSVLPSVFPTVSTRPSSGPTSSPTVTVQPSNRPTLVPTITLVPSRSPTGTPTASKAPSSGPTTLPSFSRFPSPGPTVHPSFSLFPSPSPTLLSSEGPSQFPSIAASSSPSQNPSKPPSRVPTETPSQFPSELPSVFPSEYPSEMPSSFPSVAPSAQPSSKPSLKPSSNPSVLPSMSPTTPFPSTAPSIRPTADPSLQPTVFPSEVPSISLVPTPVPPKLVFITSTTSGGNMMNAVPGADTKCQNAASRGGLSGTFLAWLSTSGTNAPVARYVQADVPYVMVGSGTVIANNFAGLVSGQLINNPATDEYGDPVVGVTPWTSVTGTGTSNQAIDCNNYRSSSNTRQGVVGNNAGGGSAWTNDGFATCDQQNPLYCFQQ